MKQLTLMRKDEKSAPGQYFKLLKQVKTKGDKLIIKGIIKDERRHLKLLNKIKRRY